MNKKYPDMHEDGVKDNQEKMKELDESGICVKCGSNPQEDDSSLCSDCIKELEKRLW